MEASAKESGYLEGHSVELQEGRDIGIEEEKKKLALKMFVEKIDQDTISRINGLKFEELENIIKK